MTYLGLCPKRSSNLNSDDTAAFEPIAREGSQSSVASFVLRNCQLAPANRVLPPVPPRSYPFHAITSGTRGSRGARK